MGHDSVGGHLDRLWRLEEGISLEEARRLEGGHMSERDAAAIIADLKLAIAHETYRRASRGPATHHSVSLADLEIIATEDQRRAHEASESTNDLIKRTGYDVDRGIKEKKIKADKRDALGYRWMRFEADWLAIYKQTGIDGINSLNADQVYKTATQYRADAEKLRVEIAKAMGGDITPGPPAPPPPDPPGTGPDWAGVIKFGAVALMVWAVASAVKGVAR